MVKVLEQMSIRSFGKPDEVREFEKGRLELVEVNGRMVGRAVFQPGWKWSAHLKPIAKTRSCEAPHFGYQISGLMKILADDGTEYMVKAGDVVNIPPGHDAWVVGEEPVVFVDFQGFVDYARAA